MQFTAGLGEARGMRQASKAACSAATQRRGSTAASILIVSETLRVGVGALRFSNRDLAITLFGMTAMLLCSVEICVERQLICTTWPSMPPSTHRLLPGL